MVDCACQTDVSGEANLTAMLFELERHNVRAVTHNRMLRLTVTRLQEHAAALEAALKAKHFSDINSDDFFGRDQGDNLSVLQDAFEDVDATLCHYVHPPGSKFQRPPKEYRDSHLWHVMPLSRQRPTPASITPAFRKELERNRALRNASNPAAQAVAIQQRCIDPSSLPGHVVDLTDEADETSHVIRLLDDSSAGGSNEYPVDLSFSELVTLSAPFDSLLLKTSQPACKLRRDTMTRTSVDLARLAAGSMPDAPSSGDLPLTSDVNLATASLADPEVESSPTTEPPTVDLPSPSGSAVHSPASTVVLETTEPLSDEDSLFGESSSSDVSGVEPAGISTPTPELSSASTVSVVHSRSTLVSTTVTLSSQSRKRVSSPSSVSSPESCPTKRHKTQPKLSKSSGSSASRKSSTPKSSKPINQRDVSRPPNSVTMRDPKPGMFSRDIPSDACEALCREASSYILGHPDYFQGHFLVTPQRTLGEWTKDGRPSHWRTEAMLRSIIEAKPWRKLAKRWPHPVTFCIKDSNFVKLWSLILDEVSKKAEWLWWRHHSLFFRCTTHFSPDIQAYIARRKSTCSMPGGLFRSVYIHVAELIHKNICTASILEDVCFPRISRSLVYLEPPPETSTYKELKAFFKAEDSKHPWRLYYADSKLVHLHPFFRNLAEAQQAIYRFTPLQMRRSLILSGKAERVPRSFPSVFPPVGDVAQI